MSNICQLVSEVIPIDDDDDDGEDVEVVFTNLNKSDVYRNLICQKISQEIELLQAMSKHTVPNKFDEFKEEVKKWGFQFGDDVIQSAWQRIVKKYLMKLTSFSNNKAPVCLVRPLQPSIDVSPSRANAPLSSPHSSVTGPSSSLSITSTAVPIALLLNTSINTENSPRHRTECLLKHSKLIYTIEVDADDSDDQTTNVSNTANKEVVSTAKSRYSQKGIEPVSKDKVPIEKMSSNERKSKTGDFSSDLDKQGLSKSRLEEPSEIQSSFVNPLSKSYFDCLLSEQNRLGEKKKVTRKYSQKRKSPSKNNIPNDDKCSKKRRSETNVFSSDLQKQCLSKSASGESIEIQNSFLSALPENYFHSVVSEQNHLDDVTKVTRKSSRKSSSKQVVPVDSPKGVDQAIAKSHVGVKAKISETNVFSSDLQKQCLSKSASGESIEIQNSFLSALSENYFHSVVSEQNHLDDAKKVTRKSSRKSSRKQVVPVDSPKAVDQAIAKSHVGVKAKIVRTKRTSQTNSRKGISKTIKEMSEADLKKFKSEQKRLKYEEKHQFEMLQLQKVHDRLVDVLIPKYYCKNMNEKG